LECVLIVLDHLLVLYCGSYQIILKNIKKNHQDIANMLSRWKKLNFQLSKSMVLVKFVI
jgi:hypothetical protein